ncbi:MAG: hypothetical protein WBD30_00890 [Bacteroidota bacterium]
MTRNLTTDELIGLLQSAFGLTKQEKGLTILVDLPSENLPDRPEWKDRRRFAAEWFTMLRGELKTLHFSEINFCVYPNVGSNNNDLPQTITLIDSCTEKAGSSDPRDLPLSDLLASSSVVIALTELSATAPLKVLAREYGFRGATMPGFSRNMIPALRLDYEKVNKRVTEIKQRMDRATGAKIILSDGSMEYESYYDLRHRTAHASGGVIRESGNVANLPSGEAYVVPYEGEREGDASRTSGLLPVEFDGEIVVFEIRENRSQGLKSSGKQSTKQEAKLRSDPAYGNIAELGVGVLGEWGVAAAGSTLLDEKLGLHIAFGRSDHFGGATGPDAFLNPRNVVHIDWVYVPSIQPKIQVRSVEFQYDGEETELIMESGKLVV